MFFSANSTAADLRCGKSSRTERRGQTCSFRANHYTPLLIRCEMPPDEFRGRDRLRLVARANQRVEMMIGGDDPVRTHHDGAVRKSIVIGIARDRVKTVAWPDAVDAPVQQVDQGQKAPHIFPPFLA